MTSGKPVRSKSENDLKPILSVARPLPRVKKPCRSTSSAQHGPSVSVQLRPKKVNQQDVLNCNETTREPESSAIHTLATLYDRSQMRSNHTSQYHPTTLARIFQVRLVSTELMRNISFMENPVDNALSALQNLSVSEQQTAQGGAPSTPSYRVIYRRGQINEENDDDLYN